MDMQSKTSPWLERGVSYKAKYFSKLGLIFIAIVLSASVGFMIISLSILKDTPNDFLKDRFPGLLISTVVTGAGILILIKIIKTMRAPISFTPSYDQVSPRQLGHPFDVWYQQPEFSQQSLDKEGTIHFDSAHVILTGKLSRTQGGLISSIISLLMKSEESSVQVPYEGISKLTVKGRRISFNIGGNRIIFYVSEIDGERIYRELKQHFPSAVAEFIIQ